MIGNLNEISLFTQAYFTMLTTIHESKNYRCFLLFIDLQAAIILVLLGYPLLRIFLFQYYIGSTECGKKHPTPKTHLSRKEAETIKPSNQHHFYILLCLGCGVFINKTFLLYSMISSSTKPFFLNSSLQILQSISNDP